MQFKISNNRNHFPSVIDKIVILIQSYIMKGNVFKLEINNYNVKSSIANNISLVYRNVTFIVFFLILMRPICVFLRKNYNNKNLFF